MLNKKIVLSVGGIICLTVFYLALNKPKEQEDISKQKVSTSISNSIHVEQKQVQEKNQKVQKISKNSSEIKEDKNIPHYKDIFKEADQISTLEQVRTQNDIKKIDEEVDKLIGDADQFIKENNLVLAQEKLTAEQKEQKEEYLSQIDSLQDELKELSNDKSE
jgi:hypothetical protein